MTDAASAPVSQTRGRTREDILRDQEAVRARTLAMMGPVADEDLVVQHDPIVSPLNWDLPHIGYFENMWLVHALDGQVAMQEAFDPVLEALDNERYERAEKELPDPKACRSGLEATRAKTLQRFEGVTGDEDDPLLRDFFAYEMILNHERQHQENMVMALQFIPDGRYRPPRAPFGRVEPDDVPTGMVLVPGGPFPMGVARQPNTYDNEWPQHEVDVPAFEIDVAPVSNRDWLRFVESGGYEDATHWPEDSWDFVGGIGVRHPMFWQANDEGDWFVREFDRIRPLPLGEPVWGISWYEAVAYASWAGKRLPTEAEWEKAATWDPATGTKRTYPWGDAYDEERANLDFREWGTTPIGSWPRGLSAVGCHQMIGDVWEWTSTEFAGYEGFEAFPYAEYSEVFYDKGYYVLRGGAWSTDHEVARGSFRNWMFPHLRHLVAGLRCARDAAGAEGR